MLAEHIYDPEFKNSSKVLRSILETTGEMQRRSCLDMPCGTGRNIFLLASCFSKVTGLDINKKYLDDIKTYLPVYNAEHKVVTQEMNILQQLPQELDQFDLIVNIHYYNYHLLSGLTASMRPQAFIYIETPGCAGENYKDLPSEGEVQSLFNRMEILMYKESICKSAGLQEKSRSFKALLRKLP
jgi:SAM-dependent methyltransferase